MNLTKREKEVLNVFGCMNYQATMKRLGIVSALAVDPITKVSVCSLRNKLAELPCDIWYRHIFCRTRQELCGLDEKRIVA